MNIGRLLGLLGLMGTLVAPVSGWTQQDAQSPAARVKTAVDAMGGAKALGAIKQVVIKGRAKHWEPEQSYLADGEMRYMGESTFTFAQDFTTGASRTDWDRSYLYPRQVREKFSEVIAEGVGYVIPEEGPAKAHAMSGMRLAATLREQLRSSPIFLLKLAQSENGLKPLPNQRVGKRRLPAVAAEVEGHNFQIMFDPRTHLPARIRVLDYDNIQGDSTFDLVPGDWKSVGGVKMAHRIDMELNGRVVAHYEYIEITVVPALPPDTFAIPANIKATADRAATGNIPYQWVIRRLYLGLFVDSNALNYDPAQSKGLRLVELAPNIQHVVGGTHNSLIVEMKDYLVVFDAPINEWQSRFTIDAAKARYPGKPIKYLVLSHHHMDHTGGSRTYVAEGATVIVGAPNKAHFEKVFSRPHKLDMDALERAPRRANIIEVADRMSLKDDTDEIQIIRIENPHAEGMLIMYVVKERVGFVVDLWSPVREKTWGPGPASLLAAVRKAGLTPERFAGGHGGAAPFAELVAMSPKQ